MKLLRVGDKGKEKPALLDKNNKIRDISSHIKDFNPDFLNFETLSKLKNLDLAKLSEIPNSVRIGACINKPGKFVAIGLNYSDHAKETGAKVPAEPIVFMKATSSISGPNDDIVKAKDSKKLDWEVELAFVIGKESKNISEKDYKKLIDDIEFLQLQEQQEGEGDPEHVAMLDDLADLWEADLDGTVFVSEEPFGHKACRKEVLPQSTSEIVRITIKKPGFYIGSIAGQPANVFIPRDVTTEELNTHSYYFMNLRFNPCGRNLWTSVVVGKKIPSSSMMISTSDNTVTYKIPTPKYLIGAIIGKDGRNINNLCQSVKSWYGFTGEVPDFTIKPISNTMTKTIHQINSRIRQNRVIT